MRFLQRVRTSHLSEFHGFHERFVFRPSDCPLPHIHYEILFPWVSVRGNEAYIKLSEYQSITPYTPFTCSTEALRTEYISTRAFVGHHVGLSTLSAEP